jgi:hypothetical protein
MSYTSGAKLLGLPLVQVATGRLEGGVWRRGVARGWIAVGDVAFGVLLSVGGVAVGGVSLGGVAVGCVTVGGVAMGVLSLAGLSLGFFSLGGLAAGVVSVGGVAIGLWGALGGLAVARDFALGGLAVGGHAGDAAAVEFFREQRFFRAGPELAQHARWLVLLVFAPLVVRLFRGRARSGAPPG